MKNSFKKQKIKKSQGFTLIEMIITTSLIAFLSASMFQVVRVSDTQKSFVMAGEKIKAGLRLAQSNSLSVPMEVSQWHVCGFGVHFDSNKLQVYYLYNLDFTNNPKACYDQESDLVYNTDFTTFGRENREEIVLEEGFSVSGSEIFFRAPYGGVYSDGSLLGGTDYENIVISKNGNTKTIQINSNGKISFQ